MRIELELFGGISSSGRTLTTSRMTARQNNRPGIVLATNPSGFLFERQSGLRQIDRVKATVRRRPKSDAQLLDHATSNLLRALKRDMIAKEGRINLERLRKE